MTRGIVNSERFVEAADHREEIERKRATDVAKAARKVAKAENAAAIDRTKLAALKSGQ